MRISIPSAWRQQYETITTTVRVRPPYIVVVAAALIMAGCVIDNLTGPTTVRLGDAATYSMRFANGGVMGAGNVTPVIAMDVPIGWTLTASSYTGTANGGPITGSGSFLGSNPTTCALPAISPGYQRLYVTTALIPTILPSDSATVSLTFLAQGSQGNYTLGFWGLATNSNSFPDCASSPTTIAVSVLDLQPVGLVEDAHASGGTSSNVNLALEPGETILVNPSWKNNTASPLALSGTASSFTGPTGAMYSLFDFAAGYGTIAAGATSDSFSAGGPSYRLSVSNPATRPAAHWDATFLETLDNGITKTWTLHIGDSFTDVPTSDGTYRFVETLLHDGITAGCGGGNYCPVSSITRGQMAVFLSMSLVFPSTAIPASGAVPSVGSYNCTSGGNSLFGDVLPTDGTCKFIHYMYAQGITGGCGGGNYCPGSSVTRAQMAVFLSVGMAGSGAAVQASGTVPSVGSYNCASGGTSLFGDVLPTDGTCKFIHYIYANGITAGCGGGNYCPATNVTRAQMAVFLVSAFKLPFLY